MSTDQTPTLRAFEAAQLTASEMKKQGIRVVSKPQGSEAPRLPRDITSMADEDLMDLFVSVTSWVDYVSVQVSFAQIDERAAQRSLDHAEAEAMVAGWGNGGKDARVAIAKARRSADPEVVRLNNSLEERTAYRKLIETIASNLERDAALISRELTRRTSTITPARRAGKYL